jgi:hypothetical protein
MIADNSFGEISAHAHCTVQLMKVMSDASKNVFRVYHIKVIAERIFNVMQLILVNIK